MRWVAVVSAKSNPLLDLDPPSWVHAKDHLAQGHREGGRKLYRMCFRSE